MSSSTEPSAPSASPPAPAPAASSSASSSAASSSKPSKPTAVIVIGMAGSGKTTLMQRLHAHLHEQRSPYYLINLDPAVLDTPFGANIDIKDTVNYHEVMKQYQLGPNGGILTALNLFATRFEQVMTLVEARAPSLKYVVLDTPGQIEIFTWSASGQIIAESLASSFPTVIVYVVDTPRSQNPVTFMSNMLYACSILYKMKLPLVLAFNKTDVAPHDFATKWMSDFESFQEALQSERSSAAQFAAQFSHDSEAIFGRALLPPSLNASPPPPQVHGDARALDGSHARGVLQIADRSRCLGPHRRWDGRLLQGGGCRRGGV